MAVKDGAKSKLYNKEKHKKSMWREDTKHTMLYYNVTSTENLYSESKIAIVWNVLIVVDYTSVLHLS